VARAHAVRYWSPLLFPGICQTFEYAYEVYRADGRPDDQATRDAKTRVERQGVLVQDEPPVIVIALWEPVLYHQVGSPQVMARQCARLLEIAGRPGVLVHVVHDANPGLGGPVSLASVHGEGDVLLTGSLLEDTVTSDAAQVRKALGIFERCRAAAAGIAETLMSTPPDSSTSRSAVSRSSGTVLMTRSVPAIAAAMVPGRSRSADVELLLRGAQAFLGAVLRPDVAQILLIDAPAVLGLARFTELDERHAVAATVMAIEAAVQAGTLAVDDPETVARLWMGVLTRAALLVASSPDPDRTRDEVTRAMRALLSGLVRPAPGAG
jgi:hypothetical protein